MNIQKSNFLIHSLVNRYQLKLILFAIILSPLFCFYEVFAIGEIDEKKLSLNSWAQQIIDFRLH
jgi:hypothetical protein